MQEDDYDFVDVKKTRKVPQMETFTKPPDWEKNKGNTKLDMRINKIEVGPNNVVKIVLIYRLDYIPSDNPLLYSFFLPQTIEVIDKKGVLKKNPITATFISYLAYNYKEMGEFLFQHLNEKSIELFERTLFGGYEINEKDAFQQVSVIVKTYFQ